MLNFLNLQYFLVVAEELNITRAAEQLHISQQALSNHIAKLEESLGCQLFQRKPVFTLSYAGKQLFKAGRQIMDIQRQLTSEIADINSSRRGELRIGITYTRGQAVLPMILPRFRQMYPLVELSLVEGSAAELSSSLSHGTIDLLISLLPFRYDTEEAIPLARDRLFLVVPRHITDRLYGDRADEMRRQFTKEVDISVFQDCPFILLKKGDSIRTILDQYFQALHLSPHILLETANIQTAFALAMEGMGITAYPEMFLRSHHTLSMASANPRQADFFPLQSETTTETLAIGYSRDRYLSEIARDFIALAREVIHS